MLAGATASGKSHLALSLAEAFNGVIIAADSRTIYRDFDIGTAKPTAEEQARVPHRMIDVADPTDTYTVARFKAAAIEAIAEVHAAGKLPMLVGGTGFYIRGLIGGLSIPEVPPQPELRAKFEALADPHARLAEVDPVTAARLHPNDRMRVIRALEVEAVLGKPLSEAATKVESPYDALYLALGMDRELLYDRINRRTHLMMEMGLVEEVERLMARYGAELPLLQTLGYAETMDYLTGRATKDEAIAAIQQHTRNYAKRQLTWFRREAGVRWLDGDRPEGLFDEATGLIEEWRKA
ncbi:tRNA (adenosine(37)-N6)-dimethylallyltransferase MiaA [bacterium]|nr:tRNA (adenosine(37)-N6)-dimethylallyltransferase MiaA [bacterium]